MEAWARRWHTGADPPAGADPQLATEVVEVVAAACAALDVATARATTQAHTSQAKMAFSKLAAHTRDLWPLAGTTPDRPSWAGRSHGEAHAKHVRAVMEKLQLSPPPPPRSHRLPAPALGPNSAYMHIALP